MGYPKRNKFVTMRRKKFANWSKEAKLNKLKGTSTRSSADRFPKPCATMQAKRHWYQAVFLLPVRNVPTIPKSDVRMYQSSIVTKFRIKLKRWNAPMMLVQLVVTMESPKVTENFMFYVNFITDE